MFMPESDFGTPDVRVARHDAKSRGPTGQRHAAAECKILRCAMVICSISCQARLSARSELQVRRNEPIVHSAARRRLGFLQVEACAERLGAA